MFSRKRNAISESDTTSILKPKQFKSPAITDKTINFAKDFFLTLYSIIFHASR